MQIIYIFAALKKIIVCIYYSSTCECKHLTKLLRSKVSKKVRWYIQRIPIKNNCILFKIRKLIYAFAVFWTADVYSMTVKLNIH